MKAFSSILLSTFLLVSVSFAQTENLSDQTWRTTKFATASAKSITVATGEREVAALELPAEVELSVTAIGSSPQIVYDEATHTHTINSDRLLVHADLDGRPLLDLRFENATAEVKQLRASPEPIPAQSLRSPNADEK